MHQLIAKADVMTTNFMRSQLERYQLTYPTLKAINPRLVFAHITGYGDEGLKPIVVLSMLPAGGHARA